MLKYNSWSTLPIGVFQRLYAMGNERTEDSPYEVVAVLNDMTLEQVLDLPINDTHRMIEESQFIYEAPKKKKVEKSYTINGRKYAVNLNPDEMTTAQYIDFNTYSTDCEKHLGPFLSIFLVPEGKKYNNGYNIEFVHNEITRYFNIEDALSLAAFFLHSSEKSLKRHLLRTEAEMRVMRWKAPTKEIKEELKEAEKLVRILREETSLLFGLDLWRQ